MREMYRTRPTQAEVRRVRLTSYMTAEAPDFGGTMTKVGVRFDSATHTY